MNALARFNPFHSASWDTLRDFENRLEQFFRRPEQFGNGVGEPFTAARWSPAADVMEDENGYLIEVELPDLKREEVKVTVENG